MLPRQLNRNIRSWWTHQTTHNRQPPTAHNSSDHNPIKFKIITSRHQNLRIKGSFENKKQIEENIDNNHQIATIQNNIPYKKILHQQELFEDINTL